MDKQNTVERITQLNSEIAERKEQITQLMDKYLATLPYQKGDIIRANAYSPRGQRKRVRREFVIRNIFASSKLNVVMHCWALGKDLDPKNPKSYTYWDVSLNDAAEIEIIKKAEVV